MVLGTGTQGRLEDNVIWGGADGIYLSSESNTAVIFNKIFENRYSGIKISDLGLGTRSEGSHGLFINNEIHANGLRGVDVSDDPSAVFRGNVIRDHAADARALREVEGAGCGFVVRGPSCFRLAIAADNVLERNSGGDFGGGVLGECARLRYEDEKHIPALAAWWDGQHAAALAARAGGSGDPDWVFPPERFDVTVAPGEDVQAAAGRAPQGGSILLLPGVHEGTLTLPAGKEVHVFGRGRAVLWCHRGHVLDSEALTSSIDGLILRREYHGDDPLGIRHFDDDVDDDDKPDAGCCVMLKVPSPGRLLVTGC